MKDIHLASDYLRQVIRRLELVEDTRLHQIINNLKEEEDNLDTLIVNMEDESEVHSSRRV